MPENFVSYKIYFQHGMASTLGIRKLFNLMFLNKKISFAETFFGFNNLFKYAVFFETI